MAYVINEPCIGVKDASCTEVSPEWQRHIANNAAYFRVLQR